ncbi:RNA polymerase sigma-70 factor (ECF subfamily) [Paucibacter oligotrophus]|uniref:RNA polymerase sigma-70 factor (ECF subfamily) n=1 Tax=Roseateles oligotrophus TaxID=1769250 RepID=A0A840L4N7_9BURK|nr:sigma-70 family RNA polymerase sigma factor [Roseateles oligotrophus]MBB4842946.1 RNA polymerase sigma-70 factor (ECF subfamily) [Roseateles oligotrophus]
MPVSIVSESTLVQLYRQHHAWLLGWLHRRLNQPETAADLAQDTFMRLLRPGVELPETLRAPRAYLSTIAHGLLVNHWQRQDLEAAYLQALAVQPPALHPSAEEQAQTLELLLAVQAMLDGLAERPRRAFLLARLDGLGYAEIAAELGVSERMVKNYMAQAMLHCLRLRGDAA